MDEILTNLKEAQGPLTSLFFILAAAYILDTLSGALAAATSGTFSASAFWQSLGSHGLKVALILLQALGAVAYGGVDTDIGKGLLLTTVGTATQYLISVLASIGLNIQAAQTKSKGLPKSTRRATDPTP